MEKPGLLSVVLSFRNEELNLGELLDRLRRALEPLPLAYELIFVNDASTDRSLEILRAAASADRRVKIVTMSRRFGVAECTLAGIARSRGDAVVYLDSDLQDPPELIPELVRRWREGADVVYTVRTRRDGESSLRRFLTGLAYRLIRSVSPGVDLPVEAGDFKLVSRRVADELLRLKEQDPYLRGLVPWIGFRQVPVYYQRSPRASGESHFPLFGHPLRDLLTLRGVAGSFAVGLTSFSLFPLVAFLLLGLVLSLLSLLALLAALVAGAALSSAAALVPCFLLLFGLEFLGIGFLGLYLGRVFHEVRGRPRSIVAETVNLPPGGGEGGDRP